LVAEELAAITGVTPQADLRLRERCFGEWEGRRWDEIHAATGDAMMGMVTAPDSWRPPGGETTFELRDRALAWFRDLPTEGEIVAITHGGPIAAILGTLRGLPVADWISLIPPCGTAVVVNEER
jgi:broad specificity phosphatase PhoE